MFRLSKLADYGIVIMTNLARRPDRQFSAAEIATDSLIPQPTVSKILKMLTRAELLVSHRGAKGGYGLSRAGKAITVAEVITAIEGPIALTACIEEGSGACDIESLCPARANWQRINDAIRGALDGINVEEMALTIPEAFGAPEAFGTPAALGASEAFATPEAGGTQSEMSDTVEKRSST